MSQAEGGSQFPILRVFEVLRTLSDLELAGLAFAVGMSRFFEIRGSRHVKSLARQLRFRIQELRRVYKRSSAALNAVVSFRGATDEQAAIIEQFNNYLFQELPSLIIDIADFVLALDEVQITEKNKVDGAEVPTI